jgi:ABC-type transport system substrate-binding protein
MSKPMARGRPSSPLVDRLCDFCHDRLVVKGLSRRIRGSSALLLSLLVLLVGLGAGSGSASRVSAPPFGPLRIDLFTDDTTDPARATYEVMQQLEYAACATLLTYPDASPPANTRLQPEIAAAMPSISPDGRTYTIQIRNDYAFSPPATGVVTAESMK